MEREMLVEADDRNNGYKASGGIEGSSGGVGLRTLSNVSGSTDGKLTLILLPNTKTYQ